MQMIDIHSSVYSSCHVISVMRVGWLGGLGTPHKFSLGGRLGVVVNNMIVLKNSRRKQAGFRVSLNNRNTRKKGDKFLTTFGLRY